MDSLVIYYGVNAVNGIRSKCRNVRMSEHLQPYWPRAVKRPGCDVALDILRFSYILKLGVNPVYFMIANDTLELCSVLRWPC